MHRSYSADYPSLQLFEKSWTTCHDDIIRLFNKMRSMSWFCNNTSFHSKQFFSVIYDQKLIRSNEHMQLWRLLKQHAD